MRVDALLPFVLLALCQVAFPSPTPQVDIEHRTLDEIYAAALKESRNLTVAWGGDRELFPFPLVLLKPDKEFPPTPTSQILAKEDRPGLPATLS